MSLATAFPRSDVWWHQVSDEEKFGVVCFMTDLSPEQVARAMEAISRVATGLALEGIICSIRVTQADDEGMLK